MVRGPPCSPLNGLSLLFLFSVNLWVSCPVPSPNTLHLFTPRAEEAALGCVRTECSGCAAALCARGSASPHPPAPLPAPLPAPGWGSGWGSSCGGWGCKHHLAGWGDSGGAWAPKAQLFPPGRGVLRLATSCSSEAEWRGLLRFICKGEASPPTTRSCRREGGSHHSPASCLLISSAFHLVL